MTNINPVLNIKDTNDNLEISFDLVSTNNLHLSNSFRNEINESISKAESELSEIERELERLTNHSNGLDYMIAVISGIITGLIDSFFIGEFDYKQAVEKSYDKAKETVINKVQSLKSKEAIEKAIWSKERKLGRKLTQSEKDNIISEIKASFEKSLKESLKNDEKSGINATLKRCINKLERTFSINCDDLYKGIKPMNSISHHLDDWAHHPTPFGFIAAVISEIFKIGIFTDKNGSWHIISSLKEDDPDRIKTIVIRIAGFVIFSGLIYWLINVLKQKHKKGKEPKGPLGQIIKYFNLSGISTLLPTIYNIFENWRGHLLSDIAGSKSSPGAGMGIPGFFLAVLKEISSFPPLNLTPFPRIITEWFTNNRFDYRKESAFLYELGNQSLPIIIGDLMVRIFYIVRQFVKCYKEFKNNEPTNWQNIIPYGNRTIERMLLIEAATFTSCDIIDAAIRSVIKNGGNVYNPKLYADFALRVNFVGIGKLTISLFVEYKMGNNEKKLHYKKQTVNNSIGFLKTALIYDTQAMMWKSVSDTEVSISNMEETMINCIQDYILRYERLSTSIDSVVDLTNELFKEDENFKNEMLTLFD